MEILNKVSIRIKLIGLLIAILAGFIVFVSITTTWVGQEGFFPVTPYEVDSKVEYFLYRIYDNGNNLYFVTDKRIMGEKAGSSTPELIDARGFWSPNVCAKMPIAITDTYIASQSFIYSPDIRGYYGSIYVYDINTDALSVINLGHVEQPVDGIYFDEESVTILVQRNGNVFMRTINIATGAFTDSFLMESPQNYTLQKMTQTPASTIINLSFTGLSGQMLFFNVDIKTKKIVRSQKINPSIRIGIAENVRIVMRTPLYSYGEVTNSTNPNSFKLVRIENDNLKIIYAVDEQNRTSIFLNGTKADNE